MTSALGAAGPVILLYNSLWGVWPDTRMLPCAAECSFTNDRRQFPRADAVVFHVPSLRGVPDIPKRPGQMWVAWSLESEANYPVLADPAFLRRFDLTMTYRRQSSIWAPCVGPDIARELCRAPQPKTEPAPAVYLQSSRWNASGRIQYVAALMRHMRVDSYGTVLRNREWGGADAGRVSKLDLIAGYKFTLAFENSIAPDYVTEKFYDPLIAGSVPVYLGAPNVAEFAPAEHCFINVADFAGPSELAKHLRSLDADCDAYARYLAWKGVGPSARFLALAERFRVPPLCRLCAHLRGGRGAREEA
jgi:hypothetical protein